MDANKKHIIKILNMAHTSSAMNGCAWAVKTAILPLSKCKKIAPGLKILT